MTAATRKPRKKAAPQPPPPPRRTIWETIQSGVIDQRCRLKDVHIHDILHALGLNPSALWPPLDDDMETFNDEG